MTPMFRSLLFTTALLMAAPASLVAVTNVQAQSHSGLRSAADRYRQAALDFDRHVHRAGYFSTYDRRLADRLEDVSGEFRSAASNPRDVQRLLYHWDELNATQTRVEASLVRGCPRHDPDLIRCWRNVLEAYQCVSDEMQCFLRDSRGPYRSARPGLTLRDDSHSHGHHDHWRHGSPSWPSTGYSDPRYADPSFDDPRRGSSRFEDPRFRDPFAPVPGPPSIQLRPQGPSTFPGGSWQGQSRRDVGAAIAATILNQLLN